MSSEHYLKEGDEVVQHIEGTNADQLLFFTDRGQVYKARACDFEDTKASVLGDFIPAKLGMDDGGERHLHGEVTADYQGYMLFCLRTARWPRSTSTPTRPRPTARSCSTPTA